MTVKCPSITEECQMGGGTKSIYADSKASRLPPRPSKATPVSFSFPHPRLPVCARPSHTMPSTFKTFASARRRSVHGFAIGRRRHSGEEGGVRGRRGDGGTNANGGKTRPGVEDVSVEGTRGMLCSVAKLSSRLEGLQAGGAKRCTSQATARYPTGLNLVAVAAAFDSVEGMPLGVHGTPMSC